METLHRNKNSDNKSRRMSLDMSSKTNSRYVLQIILKRFCSILHINCNLIYSIFSKTYYGYNALIHYSDAFSIDNPRVIIERCCAFEQIAITSFSIIMTESKKMLSLILCMHMNFAVETS